MIPAVLAEFADIGARVATIDKSSNAEVELSGKESREKAVPISLSLLRTCSRPVSVKYKEDALLADKGANRIIVPGVGHESLASIVASISTMDPLVVEIADPSSYGRALSTLCEMSTFAQIFELSLLQKAAMHGIWHIMVDRGYMPDPEWLKEVIGRLLDGCPASNMLQQWTSPHDVLRDSRMEMGDDPVDKDVKMSWKEKLQAISQKEIA